MHPNPQKEHEWLQRLVGEWSYETTADMGPGNSLAKASGTETVRSLGGLWIVAEGQGSMPGGAAIQSLMTLGFDPQKGFVGTWVGSIMTHMWVYDGMLDEAGRMLTLNCRGPAMSDEGGLADYQDVIEMVDADHRKLISRVKQSDGRWNAFMEAHYRRA